MNDRRTLTHNMNSLNPRTKTVVRRTVVLVLLLLPFRLAVAADTNAPTLLVRGEVEQSLTLSFAEFLTLPRTTLKAREKDGSEAIFEGVALSEVIKRAKPRLTEKCCSNHPTPASSSGPLTNIEQFFRWPKSIWSLATEKSCSPTGAMESHCQNLRVRSGSLCRAIKFTRAGSGRCEHWKLFTSVQTRELKTNNSRIQ
jgi:hypothetical protein